MKLFATVFACIDLGKYFAQIKKIFHVSRLFCSLLGCVPDGEVLHLDSGDLNLHLHQRAVSHAVPDQSVRVLFHDRQDWLHHRAPHTSFGM